MLVYWEAILIGTILLKKNYTAFSFNSLNHLIALLLHKQTRNSNCKAVKQGAGCIAAFRSNIYM